MSDLYTLIFARDVSEDLEKIYDYIAPTAPRAAEKLIKEIRQKISTLKSMPLRATQAHEGRIIFDKTLRHLVHKNYRIIFRVDEPKRLVYILEVRHASRTPNQRLDDRL